MTHRKKDCLERPRKVGAMWTNQDIAPDEYVQVYLLNSINFATSLVKSVYEIVIRKDELVLDHTMMMIILQ